MIRGFNKVPGVNLPTLQTINLSIEAIGEFTERVQDAARESQEAAEASTRAVKLQTKSYEELAEGVASVRRELLSENFELKQQSRDIQEIIDEYEELERLKREGVFGAAEQERQANLLEELRNLRGQEGIGDLIGFGLEGSNLDAAIAGLRGRVSQNASIIAENLRDIAEESLILFQKDPGKFAQEGFSDITDYLINEFDSQTGEGLDPRQRGIVQNYLQSLIENIAAEQSNIDDLSARVLDFDSILNTQNVKGIVNTVEAFDKAIAKNKKGFSGIRQIFNSTLQDLAQFGEGAQEAFRQSNQDLASLIDNLEE
jgi:predicted transcriptional regulator